MAVVCSSFAKSVQPWSKAALQTFGTSWETALDQLSEQFCAGLVWLKTTSAAALEKQWCSSEATAEPFWGHRGAALEQLCRRLETALEAALQSMCIPDAPGELLCGNCAAGKSATTLEKLWQSAGITFSAHLAGAAESHSADEPPRQTVPVTGTSRSNASSAPLGKPIKAAASWRHLSSVI